MNHKNYVELQADIERITPKVSAKGKPYTSMFVKANVEKTIQGKQMFEPFYQWVNLYGNQHTQASKWQVGDEIRITGSFKTEGKEIQLYDEKTKGPKLAKVYTLVINARTVEKVVTPVEGLITNTQVLDDLPF